MPMVWGIMLCSLFMDVVDKNVKKPVVGALVTICVSAVATIGTGYIFGLFYGDVRAATFGVYDHKQLWNVTTVAAASGRICAIRRIFISGAGDDIIGFPGLVFIL